MERAERGEIPMNPTRRRFLAAAPLAGAAMAAEDGYVLAVEALADDASLDARLMRYSQKRYARSAFVYAFARQWMDDEQSVRTAQDLAEAKLEMAQNASARIAASDRILDSRII